MRQSQPEFHRESRAMWTSGWVCGVVSKVDEPVSDVLQLHPFPFLGQCLSYGSSGRGARSAFRLALASVCSRFIVLVYSQIPGELEPFEQLLRGRLRQPDVRRTPSPPAAGYGYEHFRSLGDKHLLQLGGQHQVPEPEMLVGEGREDVAADAEVGGAHVSGFLGVVKTKGEFSKVARVHETAFARPFLVRFQLESVYPFFLPRAPCALTTPGTAGARAG